MWGVYQPFQTIRVEEYLERRGVGRSELAVVVGWEVMAAGAWGAWLLRRRGLPISPLVGWVVTSTVVAFLNLGLHRFRASSDVALCILAAVAVDELVRWWQRPTASEAAVRGRIRTRGAGTDRLGSPDGGLPERTNGTVSKTVVVSQPPWVQIPHPPLHRSHPAPDQPPAREDTSVTRVRTTRVVAVLLAGGLVLGACGGDDGPSEAEQVEAFCAATAPLPELSADLSAIPPDATPEEAQAALLPFLDQLDVVLDAAPAEIEDEAGEVEDVVAEVRGRVEEATTTDEIKAEVPKLVQDAAIDDSVLGPVYLYVIENCPS